MGTNHLAERYGRVQRRRLVRHRDSAIEVAGGRVRYGEHIERVGIAATRQRDGMLGKPYGRLKGADPPG